MRRLALLAALLLAVPVSAQSWLIEDILTVSAGMGRTDGPFTLVSLDGEIVVAADAAVRADSASGAWDLGIRGTEIILNGGASGPGERRGLLMQAIPNEVPGGTFSLPPDALTMDGVGECPRGAARVVCHGSGNGWYEYTGNGVEPLGRPLLVQRPDGTAFHVRFVRYMLGEALASGVRPRYVTLEVAPVIVIEQPVVVPVEQL